MSISFDGEAMKLLARRINSRDWWVVISYDVAKNEAITEIELEYFDPGTPATNGFECALLPGSWGCPCVFLMLKEQIPRDTLARELILRGMPERWKDALRSTDILVLTHKGRAKEEARQAARLLSTIRRAGSAGSN